MKACGAKTRSGGKCKKPAMPNGRCRLHGGLTPSGIASPHFKTGRWSKHLPSRLLERYQASAKDPELLALGHDVALVDARLSDLLSRVDQGESGALWKHAQTAFSMFAAARGSADHVKEALAYKVLADAIEKGILDFAAWQEIQTLLEQRRRLVDTESKRRMMGHMVLKLDEANVLIAALAEAVRRHVSDRDTLSAVNAEFTRILGQQARAGLDAGSGAED